MEEPGGTRAEDAGRRIARQTRPGRVAPPAAGLRHARVATVSSLAGRRRARATVPAGRTLALVGSHTGPVPGTAVDVIAVVAGTVGSGPPPVSVNITLHNVPLIL